jgi:succinate dehydrogenase / fumarate reductase cytochrome b subunit
MDSFFVKFIMWGILTALAYHVVVGIRHLMMDFGYLDETLEAGKRSAKISLLLLSCFHFSQESSYGKQRLSTGTQRRT